MNFTMRNKKKELKDLIENYFVTIFMMWSIAYIVGANIIGICDIYLPYIIYSLLGSSVFYILHLLLYNYLSYRHNRIIKNILFIIVPFTIIFFVYLLTIITEEPTLKEFTVISTTRLPCGDKTIKPRKYINSFLHGKINSKFKLRRNNHIVTWYPNEENYYKYKQGDVIKVKVKKNFLDMEVIVQQNRDKD